MHRAEKPVMESAARGWPMVDVLCHRHSGAGCFFLRAVEQRAHPSISDEPLVGG
jgi:hypothetical protein